MIKMVNMEYEVVELEEKLLAGLCRRTNNHAPDMQQVIGGLWKSFYGDGVYQAIQDKVNMKAVGLYSDYADGADGDYDVTVGCEVASDGQLPEGCVLKRIPAGPYAKFIVRGDMHQAVGEFWEKLWSMDLDRSYGGDYEEYQNDSMDEAEIHMYIGLKAPRGNR